MLISLATSALLAALVSPTVRLQALHNSPPVSTASYLSTPRAVRVSAVLTWKEQRQAAGYLIEARVRDQGVASSGGWHEWEVASLIEDGGASSFVTVLEPGLDYEFRVCTMSERGGQEPFSKPTPTCSALGREDSAPNSGSDLGGCYLPFAAERETAATNLAAEEANAAVAQNTARASGDRGASNPLSTMAEAAESYDDGSMPWDSAGLAAKPAAPPPTAPTAAEHAVTSTWAAGEPQPLLSMVPTSADLALLQAQASLLAALRTGGTGGTRLRCDILPPGLNKQIEGSHAYSEPLLGFTALALAESLRGLKVGVIFPSAGTAAGGHAAFVQAMGRHVDPHVRMGGFSGAVTRDLIASGHDFTPGIVNPDDPCDVYIFASPANSRGDAVVLAVEQAVEKLPEASFVLLNPDLEDTVLSYTFGIHTSDKCRKFVSNFETTYAYRGIFQIERPSNRPLERGAVLHHHGGPWTAHGLCQKAGGFELLASFDSKPSKAELGGVPW